VVPTGSVFLVLAVENLRRFPYEEGTAHRTTEHAYDGPCIRTCCRYVLRLLLLLLFF
jgi:hypothetical protein